MADESPRPRVVVGLGNPGARYDGTRHNVGFQVVEALARRAETTFDVEECASRIAVAGDLVLVQPQTFMNRSGHALRCLRDRRQLDAADFLIVYDEVHLPLGTLRLRRRGSPAGHRGLESVLESLGTDEVPRLRLGVGGAKGPPPGDDLVDFVLGRFELDEQDVAHAMVERSADACTAWARDGVEVAMQGFNGPPPA
ncbi:MAG: aminoacyl-tRNA hydrolase [Acidobacteriota bacterium]